MTDFALSEFLPYRLAVAAARVSRAFSERYRKDFGLTIPEWRVLAHLSQSGTVSVREIHARVDMDKSQVSRAAARLQAAGYLDKSVHPEDGRLVALRLTPAGRALLDRLIPVALAYQADLIGRLGPHASGLAAALDRLEAVEPAAAEEDGAWP
jgi:DNA-binding MarR family transcriptional regulator